MKAALAVLMAVGVLAACNDSPASTAPVLTGDASMSNGNDGIQVSGSGHFTAVGVDTDWRTFSFHVKANSDGSDAKGSFVLHARQSEPETFTRGDILCVTVVGNRAWMVGQVTKSTAATSPVGTFTRFRVADNGEGAGSPADQISLMEVGVLTFPPYCSTLPERPDLVDIEAGNIQIR